MERVRERVEMDSSFGISQCRICHEEGRENSITMETPCACSGTLKFAHRECIQRWCDEKGNTTCEICLQKFEPGYTAVPPPKKARLADVAVTIRESLEVTGRNHELAIVVAEAEILEAEFAECSSASERSTSCCRSIALAFTMLLLVRHLVSVVNGVTDRYAFTLLTVLVLRAGGILLPLYILIRTIDIIRRCLRQQQQLNEDDNSPHEEPEEDEQEQLQIQYTVPIA
ncbi:uncharacterized protein LOC131225745 [Magnolia sinica]|uniref:uncharacterized protein LOC131225745 n=1 Tax=Magnolia sinica TaxID=86752 RepID=UPI002657D9E2|nr:uncharacterized protein LOC131225745 [Magnolia sinica]